MNPEFYPLTDADCSCLQIEVQVEESWINQFLGKQDLIIPVSEQYHLTNLKIALGDGKITLEADIKEKEGSALSITCLPKWDESQQRILLEEIDIKIHSKNIIVKSAGWFANTFMGAKIDKKIEDATNQLYAKQMHIILSEGVTIPFQYGSSASVRVRSVTINEMLFGDHSIKVKTMIDGYWQLQLSGEEKG